MKRIIVNNLSKKFKIGTKRNQNALSRFISIFSGRETKKEILALRNISFEAESGDVIGLIGKNGSGKSTLLRAIARIYDKDEGEIITTGNLISIINLNIGLKERLTMKDNISFCCSIFGLSTKQIQERFNSIVEFAELKEFVDTKLYQFSNGMLQRLAFSIAAHCNPDILLLDEVFEVGDETFKKKSAEKIKELVAKGASVLLVSHDLDIIKRYCNKIIWLDNGKKIMEGKSNEIIKNYLEDKF